MSNVTDGAESKRLANNSPSKEDGAIQRLEAEVKLSHEESKHLIFAMIPKNMPKNIPNIIPKVYQKYTKNISKYISIYPR